MRNTVTGLFTKRLFNIQGVLLCLTPNALLTTDEEDTFYKSLLCVINCSISNNGKKLDDKDTCSISKLWPISEAVISLLWSRKLAIQSRMLGKIDIVPSLCCRGKIRNKSISKTLGKSTPISMNTEVRSCFSRLTVSLCLLFLLSLEYFRSA